MKPLMLTAICLCLTAFTAQADVYKSVDADGNVTYSDKPVSASTPIGEVRNMFGEATQEDLDNANKRAADAQKAKQEQQNTAQQREQEAQAAEVRAQNCSTAKESVRTLEASGRVVVADSDGNRRFLSDDERAERLNAARKAVSDFCD